MRKSLFESAPLTSIMTRSMSNIYQNWQALRANRKPQVSDWRDNGSLSKAPLCSTRGFTFQQMEAPKENKCHFSCRFVFRHTVDRYSMLFRRQQTFRLVQWNR